MKIVIEGMKKGPTVKSDRFFNLINLKTIVGKNIYNSLDIIYILDYIKAPFKIKNQVYSLLITLSFPQY